MALNSSTVAQNDDVVAEDHNELRQDIQQHTHEGADTSFITKVVINTLHAGEAINGATLPVACYQNTSDNELYACDGNDSAKLSFLGFAISNSTDGNAIDFQTNGIVGGFTGLVEGSRYYVQDDKTIGVNPGTYPIFVGVAVSETQLLIGKYESVSFIDSNVVRTDESGAGATKQGTFTVVTPRRAKFIRFPISVFSRLQTGGNSTAVRTYFIEMDLINQRLISRIIATSTTENITTVGGLYLTGADITPTVFAGNAVSAFSVNSITIQSVGAVTARVDSIVSTENLITLSYTLNVEPTASQKAGIAIGTVEVIG